MMRVLTSGRRNVGSVAADVAALPNFVHGLFGVLKQNNVEISGFLDYNDIQIFMPCWKAGWEGGS